MISEKQLCKSFHSFWEIHFPLLNSTFMRRFNAEDRERLYTDELLPVPPVPMGTGIERFDLVAEIAFEMAHSGYKEKTGLPSERDAHIQHAIDAMALLKGLPSIPPPTADELVEAKSLYNIYDRFLSDVTQPITFRPRIAGAGILDQMEGDFCTDETLYEVKAVNRNLESSDLRQVICYIVAGLGSRAFSWSRYCIFNPRLAVEYSGRIDELLAYLSGLTAHECIADALNALMEREQPLEERF